MGLPWGSRCGGYSGLLNFHFRLESRDGGCGRRFRRGREERNASRRLVALWWWESDGVRD